MIIRTLQHWKYDTSMELENAILERRRHARALRKEAFQKRQAEGSQGGFVAVVSGIMNRSISPRS